MNPDIMATIACWTQHIGDFSPKIVRHLKMINIIAVRCQSHNMVRYCDIAFAILNLVTVCKMTSIDRHWLMVVDG